jgi:hypothetical protein
MYARTMTEGESDEATPAPFFEEREPEEPVAQEAEEELPQPIRGGYFDRMLSKLREALHRRSS